MGVKSLFANLEMEKRTKNTRYFSCFTVSRRKQIQTIKDTRDMRQTTEVAAFTEASDKWRKERKIKNEREGITQKQNDRETCGRTL